MNNKTQINRDTSGITNINRDTNGITNINRDLSGLTNINQETMSDEMINKAVVSFKNVNNILNEIANIPVGTILLDKYIIKQKLTVTSGEATLYISEYKNQDYVAKIYHREAAIKDEIIKALKKIDSPYVAKLYETGNYKGMPVEILPYYEKGSLQGKKFPLETLKSTIIPCVNEALQTLHKVGIIHKDLKPANIMMLNDSSEVAVIDFGVSSIMNDGLTVKLTRSGLTPDYSAPEALHDAFLEESDYYSFGITLYELFTGHLPYEDLSNVERARYVVLQNIPFPDDMPVDLKNLITALTYNDITHRNETNNPNRRWTYEEIKNWLEGKEQPIPGEEPKVKSLPISNYPFKGKTYNDINSLVKALATNWNEGKKQLVRRLLSDFFKKNNNPEIASYCMDAEEEININKADVDVEFFKLIYKLLPTLKEFYWKDHQYSSINELGQDILNKLRASNMKDKSHWDDMLDKGLFSKYMTMHAQPKEIIDAITSIERTYTIRKDDVKIYYLLAYLLSGKRELKLSEKIFTTIEELVDYMNYVMSQSEDEFENFCYNLINENNELNIEFESWLISLGKRSKLEDWKKNIVAMR